MIWQPDISVPSQMVSWSVYASALHVAPVNDITLRPSTCLSAIISSLVPNPISQSLFLSLPVAPLFVVLPYSQCFP